MSDLPISFSGPMVLSLLAGRKRQTRRAVKNAPENATSAGTTFSSETGASNIWTWLSGDPRDADTWETLGDFRLPYKPGDRLYVREHWRTWEGYDAVAPRDLVEKPVGLWYEADNRPNHVVIAGKFRQAMHMPKRFSRITLHCTETRVERLQEISEEDALAEGVILESADPPFYYVPGIMPHSLTGVGIEEPGEGHAARSYGKLMDYLHGAGFWERNPWLAAYSFDVELCNIAEARAA